jgi:hypothetical protein
MSPARAFRQHQSSDPSLSGWRPFNSSLLTGSRGGFDLTQRENALASTPSEDYVGSVSTVIWDVATGHVATGRGPVASHKLS